MASRESLHVFYTFPVKIGRKQRNARNGMTIANPHGIKVFGGLLNGFERVENDK
jgi:hypothetical protein